MTGLSIGHGSQNMVEIESVTLCTHNKLSLWNGMIDLRRWRLHLEWGLFLPTPRDIYETFWLSWLKGCEKMWPSDSRCFFCFFFPTAWYNLTGRLSRFCLSQYHCSPATTVSLYHLKLSSCPRKHSPRHLRCESRRAMGRDDMTSKPGWSTDKMEFVSWRLSVWTGECTWKPPKLTLSLLQLPSYLNVSLSKI